MQHTAEAMKANMESSYLKFQDDFYDTYDVSIHPSVLKLCFYKGYESGATNIYKTFENEFNNHFEELLSSTD